MTRQDYSNLISIQQACSLLQVSVPTWNKLRAEHDIKSYQSTRRRVLFDKFEVIQKLISTRPCKLRPVDLSIGDFTATIDAIKIDDNTFDLRAINIIDPYGALSLLGAIRSLIGLGQPVNLILDKQGPTLYLIVIGLFSELSRSFGKYVHWDHTITDKVNLLRPDVLYPLKVIGYRGQDKSATEELARALMDHGFSETVAGFIGWILGELSDNSLTHASGSCYLLAARYPSQKNYLVIGILDSGVGIQNSLKRKEKYKDLSDKSALLTAFKPFVSSWPDTAERGKGLTDVASIALSNKSFFRVDSCDLALWWDFTDLKREVRFIRPMTPANGVRFCFLMIDSEFEEQDRDAVNELIDKKLEQEL